MNTETYPQKRDRVLAEYKQILKSKESVRLKKSASNLFRERKGRAARLDTRDFNHVLKVDTEKMTAEVEGMTPYRTIVHETLKHNALPAVVPELATITIGGAVSGGGIEANSLYNGLVHETVLSMDILLPTGKIVTATPNNQYKDLFYGIANSFGTLGYILKLTIKLISTKPYVKVRHIHIGDFTDFTKLVKQVGKTKSYEGESVDFIDGSGFERHDMYATLGTFVDEAPAVSNYRYMRRYFESIRNNKEDYLTVRDFIWRWDTDWFWCSKAFYMNHTIPRALFGKWMLKSESYWKLLRLDQKYHMADTIRKLTGDHKRLETIIQDVQVPIEKAPEFWDFFTKNIAIRPVWFCPTRSSTSADFPLYELKPDKIYINFGFWDQVPAHADDPYYYNKLIEAKVDELGGKKGLYSEAFYKENDFWRIYNGTAYNTLKEKYDPKGRLKNLYQKCVERA
ncbi:MAG TPA: FAD-binding oxidoreductase [Candidatus Saccharimonadales bacterium]|nr:FAD-binding oxidoreductase [Candidatus Saccharimonadales bacterium]